MPVELSVVVPVYNSATIFPELHRRLVEALEGVVASFEIIAVVDGCADDSSRVIAGASETDSRVKLVEFSRNFGHQAAVTAGLTYVSGDLVAIMDDDLEDPPEALVKLVERLREGFDVVYGIRRKRKRSPLHRLLYFAFYRLFGAMVDIHIPNDAGDFCVMRRQVVDVLNSMPETNRYLRGLRAWAGFEQTGVEYERASRYDSESGYSLRKYVALALDAMFSFSYRPLTLMSLAGAGIATASFVFGLYVLFAVLFLDRDSLPLGWASVFVSVLFFSGIQLVCFGVLGQYLARVYDETKQRPNYIVKREVGFGDRGETDKPGG